MWDVEGAQDRWTVTSEGVCKIEVYQGLQLRHELCGIKTSLLLKASELDRVVGSKG